MGRSWLRIVLGVVMAGAPWGAASAQSLGSFSWQFAPYCNVVTLQVRQDGPVYTLDGYDDQCGGTVRAAASGTAFLNPDGSIGMGLTIVDVPGGVPVHVDVVLSLSTLGGPWTDSHENSGSFVFTSGGPASGSPRPIGSREIPDGSITEAKLASSAVGPAKIAAGAVGSIAIADGAVGASDIDSAQVQRRVAAGCPVGQVMTGVLESGAVSCAAATGGTGDITSVTAGAGLSGGGTSGAVTLAVNFAGPGSAPSAARSDHTHERPGNDGNVGVGPGTLASTTGVLNTAVGAAALQLNISGSSNVGIGRNALLQNTTGSENTAVGISAMFDNLDGSHNVAVGAGALNDMSSGASNVALGSFALRNLTSGNGNIAVGSGGGGLLTSGSDNIYVGHNGATESGTIRIGRSTSHTRAYLAGIRGVTTGQPNAVAVVIDSAGQLGTVSSSRSTKFDIGDLATPATDALQRLRPVQFRYRQAFSDGTTPIQYGLIAEEVQEVLPELVALDERGQPATVKYHVLPSLLLADVQRLERERQRLETALTVESARVAELERRLDDQARAIDALRDLRSRPASR